MQHAVMLTLGTGIGGGVISHNSLIKGSTGMGAELGHMIMEIDGRLHAGTGVKGVFEAYSSATGVRQRAQDAVDKEVGTRVVPDNLLHIA
jgi:glucokinase